MQENYHFLSKNHGFSRGFLVFFYPLALVLSRPLRSRLQRPGLRGSVSQRLQRPGPLHRGRLSVLRRLRWHGLLGAELLQWTWQLRGEGKKCGFLGKRGFEAKKKDGVRPQVGSKRNTKARKWSKKCMELGEETQKKATLDWETQPGALARCPEPAFAMQVGVARNLWAERWSEPTSFFFF